MRGGLCFTAPAQRFGQLAQRVLALLVFFQQCTLLALIQVLVANGLAAQAGPPFQGAVAALARGGEQAGDSRREVFFDQSDLGVKLGQAGIAAMGIAYHPLHGSFPERAGHRSMPREGSYS